MANTVLNVEGMSCSHCEKSVKNALTELGANEVFVDLDAKTVTVSYDENRLSLEKIKSEIVDIGYEVV